MILLSVLLYYYQLINAGNYTPQTLKDYAVVESLVAGVDPQKVIYTINAESGFNTKAVHLHDMAENCNSHGLVQIRDCDHKDVSVEQAENPIFAVNYLIQNLDKCGTWWQSTCGRYLNDSRGLFGPNSLTGKSKLSVPD